MTVNESFYYNSHLFRIQVFELFLAHSKTKHDAEMEAQKSQFSSANEVCFLGKKSRAVDSMQGITVSRLTDSEVKILS